MEGVQTRVADLLARRGDLLARRGGRELKLNPAKYYEASDRIRALDPRTMGPQGFYQEVEKVLSEMQAMRLPRGTLKRYEWEGFMRLIPISKRTGFTAGARPTTGAKPATGARTAAGASAGARYTAGAGSAAGARPATGAGPTAGTGFTAGARYTAGAGSATGARPATGARTAAGASAGARPTRASRAAGMAMDELVMLGEKHAVIPVGLTRNTAALLVHPDKFGSKTISQKQDALQRFGVDTTGLTSDEMNIVADTIVKGILR